MRILLAIDGSGPSEAATHTVIRQMRPNDAEVCVLHVVEPQFLTSDAGMAHLREKRQELVARAGQLLEKAGFKVSTAVEEGDPRFTIPDYAKTWRADLIVVASHGKTRLDRLLIGSVSESVARHAHCSVQVVRG